MATERAPEWTVHPMEMDKRIVSICNGLLPLAIKYFDEGGQRHWGCWVRGSFIGTAESEGAAKEKCFIAARKLADQIYMDTGGK